MASTGPAPLRYAIAGMIAMAVAMGIGRFVYTPILPGMMDEIGLSASDAGLVASANYLGYLVGALIAAGGWAEGRERCLALAGLGASTLLAAAMGLTQDLAIFLAIRFLAGVASAFLMVFLASIVFSRLAIAGRNDLQAVHFGGVGLGIATSALMTGALVVAGAGWTAGWFWAAAISAIGFVVVVFLVDGGPVVTGERRREPPLPRHGPLLRLIVAYGIFGFGYVITATFLVAIVRQGEGGRLFESAVWLVTGLLAMPSVYLWSRLAGRIGLATTYAVGCLVEAVGVAASVILDGYLGPLISAVLLGGTFVAITALGLQAGRLFAPQSPRRVFALMTASFGLGQILGPVVAGYMADWTGSFLAPSLVAAGGLLVCGAIGWSVGSPEKSPRS